MRVLGVDPGLRLTGYALIDAQRDHPTGDPTLEEAGVIRLPVGRSVADRLVELDQDLREIIHRLRPDAVCVEALFAHYKRPATAIVMGHARGVILLAARSAGLPIAEVPPAKVKKSLTGFGRAGKEQVQLAVQAQLRLAEPPRPPDVADAIAIALCAARGGAVAVGGEP